MKQRVGITKKRETVSRREKEKEKSVEKDKVHSPVTTVLVRGKRELVRGRRELVRGGSAALWVETV